MKRIFSIILALSLILALAACGGNKEPSGSAPSGSGGENTQTAAPESTTPADADPNTPEGYPWTEFQQMSAGEYFKGELFAEDYMSRADINKGLPVEQKSDVRIGVVAATLANPFFTTMNDAIIDQAEQYGYEVSYVSYDQETSKMVGAIEDFVTQGVDAIILDPMDMNSAALACDNAADAGVVTIAVGQPMPSDSAVLTSIYPYYYGVAFENGCLVVERCFDDPETEIVAGYIMIVPTWHTWGCGYMAGMYYTRMEQLGTPVTKEEAMEKCYEYYLEFFEKGSVEIPEANIKMAGYNGEGGQNEATAMAAAEALIASIPDLNLLLPVNDFQAAGAIMALENSGLVPGEDVFLVVSNDGSTQALEMIRDGKLVASGNSAPELMGRSAVDLLHKIFEEGYDANDLLMHTTMPAIAITSDNWEEFYVEGSTFAKIPEEPVEFRTTQEAFEDFLASQAG